MNFQPKFLRASADSLIWAFGKVALPGLENVPLGPASVVSLNVPPDVPPGEVIIEATVPVAVQRRMARNHGLVGFSIVGGLPVQVSR